MAAISFKFSNFYFFEFCPVSTRPCVLIPNHQFKAIRAVKLLQYVKAFLNLKGFSFFLYTLYYKTILNYLIL